MVSTGSLSHLEQVKESIQSILKESPGFDTTILEKATDSTNSGFSAQEVDAAYQNLEIIHVLVKKAVSLHEKKEIADSDLQKILARLNCEKMKMVSVISSKPQSIPLSTESFSKITINTGFVPSKVAARTEGSLYNPPFTDKQRKDTIDSAKNAITSSKSLTDEEKKRSSHSFKRTKCRFETIRVH